MAEIRVQLGCSFVERKTGEIAIFSSFSSPSAYAFIASNDEVVACSIGALNRSIVFTPSPSGPRSAYRSRAQRS